MSKKIILILSLLPIFFILFIFYTISDLNAIEDEDLEKIGILESRQGEEYNYKNERNHLSEIRDLYSNLEQELEEEHENLHVETNEEPEFKSEILPAVVKKDETQEIKNELPKLTIIIDDVAVPRQAKKIRELNYNITMSFFPSDSNHPQTHKLAKQQEMYMLHLPLQAKNFSAEEIDTLHVGDNQEEIRKRIEDILKDFPNLKYMNNHTGSRFTSDTYSMRYLLKILKEKNITFIDSVTTGDTVVEKVAKEFGILTLRRDIFLDNITTVSYIQKQLRKAVAIAKKKGFAIAIGHPHKTTIRAIANSKDILKDVEIVYISEIVQLQKEKRN
jgi:polysaccharide deacetylase 2 family uncharacterized protein YibQ